MNRLQFETSPYLTQHKDNPVDWYPWGEVAFRRAREEDKPILLSIGYSSCHWCHVMAHESFENPAIAKIMNDLFINIKVDREERPDVDSIYMNFVQVTTGSGGWPLTVFLTPDLIPFFGGTYFPPEDRYGRPGFVRIMHSVSEAYKTRKNEIYEQKQEIIRAISSSGEIKKKPGEFILSDFNKAFSSILRNYDETWGGFGNAPKFPAPMTHMFLLRYFSQTGNKAALEIVENSLTRMAEGGIYDQIGGGFHRYSTDEKWLVPHFEKMLYDNAMLSRIYLETYQLTKDKFYLTIAEDILNYVLREMTSEEGGFYSSQDADSEGVEGKFYVWEKQELKNFLSEHEFDTAVNYYGITEKGNFEGKNILTSKYSIDEMEGKHAKVQSDVKKEISVIKKKIYSERIKRVPPSLDDKILTNWNALMLYSFAFAYGITAKERFYDAAVMNAELLWQKCFKENILMHSYKDGTSKIEGFLDDYALLTEAFIKLYEVTSDEKWLKRGDTLAAIIIDKFYNIGSNDFYFTTENEEGLIVRHKEIFDNTMPGGSSSASMALMILSIILNKPEYYIIAGRYISQMHELILNYPENLSYLLSAAYFYFARPKEIALIAVDEENLRTAKKGFFNDFFPFTVFTSKNEGAVSELEIMKSKNLVKSPYTIYICQNYVCQTPVFSIEELRNDILQNSKSIKT